MYPCVFDDALVGLEYCMHALMQISFSCDKYFIHIKGACMYMCVTLHFVQLSSSVSTFQRTNDKAMIP